MIKLIIAEDETLVRQALVSLLGLHRDLEIVGEAANGAQAAALASSLRPDVVLMDIQMPVLDGVQATARIKQSQPMVAVLLLTTYDEDEPVRQAFRHGANGYLLKESSSEQIAGAIRSVHDGHTVLGPSVAPKLVAAMRATAASPAEADHGLTPRETEILLLLRDGKHNEEIASCLHVGEKTVRDHIFHVLQKLNLQSRTQAALWAYRHLHG